MKSFSRSTLLAALVLATANGANLRKLRPQKPQLSAMHAAMMRADAATMMSEMEESEKIIRQEMARQAAEEREMRDADIAEKEAARAMLYIVDDEDEEEAAIMKAEQAAFIERQRRNLNEDPEILSSGKILFNGKVYDADQIQIHDYHEDEDELDNGAVSEDRPEDEDDVSLVNSVGAGMNA